MMRLFIPHFIFSVYLRFKSSKKKNTKKYIYKPTRHYQRQFKILKNESFKMALYYPDDPFFIFLAVDVRS